MGNRAKINIVFDTETGDPDDLMTLCLLANHSRVNLLAVTVTKGSNAQVGLIKHVLRETGLDIPVGAYRIGYEKREVSPFHDEWFSGFEESDPDGEGYRIILEALEKAPGLTLLTGAPMKNISKISEGIKLDRWVAQGGFAGDNVVPPNDRLPKFEGLLTSPTTNFNKDYKTAFKMLGNSGIKERYLVSKNVCHGVIYNREMHEQFALFKDNSPGLNFVYKGMELYFKYDPNGKKFHDPLALAAAIDLSVCEFRAVELYRKQGKWGSVPKADSNTFISINANVERMVEILTDQ